MSPIPSRSTFLWTILRLAAFILCFATVAGFAARQGWMFDYCSRYRLHYLILLALLCVLFLLGRKGGMMLLTAAFALTNLWQVASAWVPGTMSATTAPVVRVVFASVDPAAPRLDSLVALIRRDSISIVAISGLDSEGLQRLRQRLPLHRYVQAQPRKDLFGAAVLSLHPITAGRIETIGRSHSPVVLARCHTPRGDLTVVAARLVPPASEARAAERNAQLADLGALIEREEGVLLLARLELTPWSPWFDDLLGRGNLRDGRRGIGVVPTTRGAMFLPGLPLDHLLHSEGITVSGLRAVPTTWSDHLPLVAELQLADNDGSRR